MKSTKHGVAHIVIVAISLMAAALGWISAQGSSVGQASVSAGRAAAFEPPGQTSEAQVEIARANLVGKLEAALGSDFGGVWFKPSTAQLHVGVTSPAGRRGAEALAAQAGLAGSVTEVSVRSSWAQLVAAQERWDRRLADLFQREEVKTWRAPDRNSVEVELGSSVPSGRVATLEREASAADFGVSIKVAPHPYFRIKPQARCKAFKKDEAHCDTPIVAGVTIKSEVVNSQFLLCTAGPAVMLKDRPTSEAETETFILTAGHCPKKIGGVGGKWYAFTKNGEEKEIGQVVEYLHPQTDVAVIKVNNPGHWASKGFVPVTPTLALWDAMKETEPFGVTGEAPPAKGNETCISGQTSGIRCGKIKATGVSIEEAKELVEVEKTTTKDGDSGGPWYTKGSANIVEGTHKGEEESSGNPLFQPLEVSFKELKKYVLLTKSNEVRHP